MRSALAAVAVVVAGLLASPASGAPSLPPVPGPGYGVAVTQLTLDADGDPTLVANTEDPGAPITWRVCTPECGTVVGTERLLRPGPTPAGTTFEASTTVAGETRATRSAPWQGRVALTSPPTLGGDLRIGRIVTAGRGSWSGGWGSDADVLELRACPTAEGTDCRSVSPGAIGAVVDPAYAGWYLGAVDRHFGPNPVFPGVATIPPRFGTVSGVTALPASTTIALGPLVGPVPAARPGTPPRVAGRLAEGATVHATPGTWPDAPGDGLVATGLRACPTRTDGPRCRVIARAGNVEVTASGRGRAVLASGLLGWYVGAFERHGQRSLEGSVLPGDDSTLDALPVAGPAVVLGPLSRTPVRLARTPRVALRSTGAPRGSRLDLGRVRCTGRCVVRSTVRGDGRSVAGRTAGRGDVMVAVRRSAFPRRVRSLRVRIRVDHSTVDVRRTVRVRPR